MSSDKYVAASKAVVKGFLLMARNLSDMMIGKLMGNYEVVSEEMLDGVDTDSIDWQVIRPLRYIREIARRTLAGEQEEMEVENDVEPKCEVAENLIAFCGNVVKMMERIK